MESYRLQKVNFRKCNSITAKIISKKCTYKELLCTMAYLVREIIESFLLYCFVLRTSFLSNIKISHKTKVYLNIKMNLTSEVNIRFTFSDLCYLLTAKWTPYVTPNIHRVLCWLKHISQILIYSESNTRHLIKHWRWKNWSSCYDIT